MAGVNSGFENKISWTEIFTPEVARDVFGEHAEHILTLLVDKDRYLEDHNVQPEGIFSLAGPLTVSASGPWVNRIGGQLVEVICILTTAGSTSTVVTIYKNGVSIGTVTLASSATLGSASFANIPFLNGVDKLHVGVTTAGTGADSLTVHARFV